MYSTEKIKNTRAFLICSILELLDNQHTIGNKKVQADYFVNDDNESELGEDNIKTKKFQ